MGKNRTIERGASRTGKSPGSCHQWLRAPGRIEQTSRPERHDIPHETLDEPTREARRTPARAAGKQGASDSNHAVLSFKRPLRIVHIYFFTAVSILLKSDFTVKGTRGRNRRIMDGSGPVAGVYGGPRPETPAGGCFPGKPPSRLRRRGTLRGHALSSRAPGQHIPRDEGSSTRNDTGPPRPGDSCFAIIHFTEV